MSHTLKARVPHMPVLHVGSSPHGTGHVAQAFLPVLRETQQPDAVILSAGVARRISTARQPQSIRAKRPNFKRLTHDYRPLTKRKDTRKWQ